MKTVIVAQKINAQVSKTIVERFDSNVVSNWITNTPNWGNEIDYEKFESRTPVVDNTSASYVLPICLTNPLNQGLVGYYKFDGNALDYSGARNHGVLYGENNVIGNQPSFLVGIQNQALRLENFNHTSYNGVNSYAQLPPSSFNSSSGFSVSLWVKYVSSAVDKFAPEHGESIYAITNCKNIFTVDITTKGEVFISYSNGSLYGYNSSMFSIGKNNWAYLTAVVKNNIMHFYANGRLISSTPFTNGIENLTNLDQYLGYHCWASGFEKSSRFNGLIDELRIYNRGLSTTEVLQLYGSDSPICASGDVNLFAPQGATTYEWSGPNNFSSKQQNPIRSKITSNDAGMYRRISSFGACKDTSLIQIIVNECNCRYTDSLELLKFYNATNGPNWTQKWDLKKPMDTWYGIRLNTQGCVQFIDLGGRFESIFSFDTLNAIAGQGNNLKGDIPSTISSLKHLEMFNVSNNDLTGIITESIWELSKLKALVLYSNQKLIIPLDLRIANLKDLQILDLGFTQVNSYLPKEIYSLVELRRLWLPKSGIKGVVSEDINRLTHLNNLSLRDNDLNGDLPQSIWQLTNLMSLGINGNNFNPWQLPKSIRNLQKLSYLDIQRSNAFGSVPDDILSLTKLGTFFLGSNNIDKLPTFSKGTLSVSYNKLTFDDILPNLKLLIGYAPQDSIYRDTTITLQIGQTLNIDLGIDAAITTNSYQWYKNNQIFGSAINSNKFTITNVKTTDAGTYRVRVTNPQAPNLTLVSHSIKLIVIAPKPDTNSCRYRDSLELVKLYNATNGPNWVNKWDLTKPINTWNGISLNAQGCVTNIVLASNKLSGKLPNLNMPELTSLWLVDNQLVGEIPNFNLPKLFRLLLYGNQFSGNIPVFNHTPELSILQLAKNKLTGPIPNFSLPKLTAVILFDNQLSGAIPNLNIPKLQYLALNSNNLTGAVPKFNFPELFDLRLNNNNLTELPEQNTLVKMRDSLLMHTNSFTFDDIIPNLEVITRVGSKAKYAPQKPIVVLDSIRNALVGQSLTINLNIDANLPQDSPNTYTWEKDGKAFMTITGSNKLVFNNLKLSDAGVYTFKVTNPKAPQLTLTGNRIRITVTCTSNTQPIAIKTSRTKICQGDTLKLSVDQTAYTNFRWSNNQTTAVISPNIAQTTTFTVSANDSQGCPTSGTQTISVVPKPKFEIFQVTKNCVDYLELEIDPATKVSRYAWNNQKNSASIQINTPGKYVLTITDVNGCREKDSVTVTSLTKPFTIKDSVIVVPDCGQANGEIWVSASPKTGNYAYQWIPDDVGNGENHRTNLPAGIYTLVVSNPNASCTDSLQLELVTEDCNTELRIFPSFTPNGDNVNETFEIHPLKCSSTSLAECFPNNELLIINRLNHTIFQKAPYNSDWDGENYPVGVYYYIFFPDKNNRKMSLKGWLTLLR